MNAFNAAEVAAEAVANAGEARPPRFSDDGLALGFSGRHDGKLLYVPTWSTWLRWDGCRWAHDDTLHVFDLVRLHCRAMAVIAEAEAKRGDAISKSVTAAATVSAVERLARSDRRHARSADAFDADP